MNDGPFTKKTIKILCDFLKKNETLERIELQNCGILDDNYSFKYFCDSLKQNYKLENVDLSELEELSIDTWESNVKQKLIEIKQGQIKSFLIGYQDMMNNRFIGTLLSWTRSFPSIKFWL